MGRLRTLRLGVFGLALSALVGPVGITRAQPPDPDEPLPRRGYLPPAKLVEGLNRSLEELEQLKGGAIPGGGTRLGGFVLGRVNVTRVKGGGDIRLLRRADPPEWPAALQGPALGAERKRVEEALAEARKHARSGKVPAEVVKGLAGPVDRLKEALARNVGDLTPSQYVEARSFLKRLEETVAALGSPDLRAYFAEAEELAHRGKTLADVVSYLKEKGLRFTPPGPGDEEAYRELHRALTASAARARERGPGK